MSEDPELDAMAAISRALARLNEDAIGRVLRWAADRYAVPLSTARRGLAENRGGSPGPDGHEEDGEEAKSGRPSNYADIAHLYDAASPKSEADKALVAAYWHQIVQGKTDFGAQEVNTSLKHLGHGLANVTTALSQLMGRKPRLVMQTHKSGKTRQARKTYKLTREGNLAVERMTEGRGGDE